MILAPPLTLHEAAELLGIKPGTLYKWCGDSRRGKFKIGPHKVTINCRRTSTQGKYLFDRAEIERLIELMTLASQPQPTTPHRRATPPQSVGRMPLGIPRE